MQFYNKFSLNFKRSAPIHAAGSLKKLHLSVSKSLASSELYLCENSCELVVSQERVVVSGRF